MDAGSELLRAAGPVIAALAAVLLFDRMTRRRGLDPPGFRAPLRRIAGTSLVAFSFYVGIFAALGTIGRQGEIDLSRLQGWQLFSLHGLFALTIVGWWAAGYLAGAEAPRSLGAGPGAGGEGGFAEPPNRPGPPASPLPAWRSFAEPVDAFLDRVSRIQLPSLDELDLVTAGYRQWLAAQPILLRLGIAASAGLVEETFFRGFLQPRIGIALSTAFFAMAHLSYDQPIMLVGVTLLSLLYGLTGSLTYAGIRDALAAVDHKPARLAA